MLIAISENWLKDETGPAIVDIGGECRPLWGSSAVNTVSGEGAWGRMADRLGEGRG